MDFRSVFDATLSPLVNERANRGLAVLSLVSLLLVSTVLTGCASGIRVKESALESKETTRITAFPWPAPKPTEQALVSDGFFAAPSQPRTLGDAARKLTDALASAGYEHLAFYRVPGGFAAVTRMEQTRDDGTPFHGTDRWTTQNGVFVWDLPTIIALLLHGQPHGYYQVMVFVVTAAFELSPHSLGDATTAQSWYSSSPDLKLPADVAALPWLPTTTCNVLVYAFEKPPVGEKGSDEAHFVTPKKSHVPAEQHLRQASLGMLLSGGTPK